MARTKTSGYTTVHAVQFYDDKAKVTVEIAPGKPYTGPEDQVEALLKAGAIREATDADAEGTAGSPLTAAEEAERRGGAPVGYAAGTAPMGAQNVYPGGVDNPNDIPAGPEPTSATGDSDAASAKLPASRSTPR